MSCIDDQGIQLQDQIKHSDKNKQKINLHGEPTQISKMDTQTKENQISQDQKSLIPGQHKSNYRPDIDGLRTIAVGIVIIFHAWPNFMTGGFIGVDVFFVISGYLISGIIIKEVSKQQFSYKNFYSRRIKRIYPALILVLITVMFMSCWNYYKERLVMVSKTVMASAVFAANLEIMTNGKGYFDIDVKTNPLLHLWSLGVEQQFYIIWPCFLSIIISRFKINGLRYLIILTIFSFLFGIFAVNKDAKFAFYFPVLRFWQMAIGGIISYINLKIKNNDITNALSIGGVVLIMGLVWTINEQSLYPGWWALLPTLSAAAIILAGKQAYLNKNVLSTRGFVFIGKISYPMYLWHWPLLVFMRQFSKDSSSWFFTPVVMIVLTIILSIGTYFVVQKPLRYKKSIIVVIGLFLTMISIGIFAVVVFNNPINFSKGQQFLIRQYARIDALVRPGPDDYIEVNGKKLPNSSKNKHRQIPTRQMMKYATTQHMLLDQTCLGPFGRILPIPEDAKSYNLFMLKKMEILNEGKQNTLLILGDSHASFLASRFGHLYEQSLKTNTSQNFPTVLLFSQWGYPFLPCSGSHNYALQVLIKKHKPKRVLIANRWTFYFLYKPQNIDGPLHKSSQCWHGLGFKNQGKQSFADAQDDMKQLQTSLKRLKAEGIQVYVANIQADIDQVNPWLWLQMDEGTFLKSQKPYRLSEWRQKNKLIIDLFQKTVQNAGVHLINFTDNTCWQDLCDIVLPSGYPVHSDDNHYTTYYNKYWMSSVDFLADGF